MVPAMAAATNRSSSLVFFTEPSFGALDYAVLAVFLTISGAVGVFFSRRSQNKTTLDYFFGNRRMSAVPIGISTGVSFMSAVSIVGLPAEIYNNGWSYIIVPIVGSVTTFVLIVLISKIVHPLKLSSLHEYFERRFQSKAVSKLANVIILLAILHYMGACMYGAVLALNGVTGGKISVVLALVVGCSVGIFYTSIGGLKAVIWTDVLQCGIMFSGVFAVVIKCMLDNPDLGSMFAINRKFGRLDIPSLSPDLTIRHSMWGLTFGASVIYATYATNPVIIQRINSLDKQSDCYIVAAITSVIYLVFSILPAWAALSIFSYYAGKECDVLAAGWIKDNDILMYYIRDRLAFPGFQGLFMAALFAGSLSSLSSGLNTVSSIIWNDFLRPCFRQEPSEFRATLMSKIIVVLFGAVSMMWTYGLLSFGGLMLQVLMSTDAAINGAYLSLFVFAAFCRYGTWKGAIAGTIFSFVLVMYLGVASLFFGKSHIQNLPTTVDSCPFTVGSNKSSLVTAAPSLRNGTITEDSWSVFNWIHSISYLWFPIISLLSFLVVALLVTSCTTDRNLPAVDPNLLCCACRPNCCECSCCHRTDGADLEVAPS